MKFKLLILAILTLSACSSVVYHEVERPVGETEDIRLSIVDAASSKWLRKPVKSRDMATSDPIAQYCTEPGWSYIFYDDMAVIGYEPFPDAVAVMHSAVAITVELWNRDNPDRLWGFINVSLPSPPPPVTNNDPVLLPWQFALVLDDGTIVQGPFTAEFDWEWAMWKSSTAGLQLDLYNRDHDPDAHIVWGPDL